MFDPTDPNSWFDDLVGASIRLSDQASLQLSIDTLGAVSSIDTVVQNDCLVREQSKLCVWRLLECEGEASLVLMAKVVDRALDLRVYGPCPPAFAMGNRLDILTREQHFLFQQPATDSWRPSELLWTVELSLPEVPEVTYQLKDLQQPTYYGHACISPELSGMPNPVFAAITEYRATMECANSELLILELGGEECENGGAVYIYVGRPILPHDVEVLQEAR